MKEKTIILKCGVVAFMLALTLISMMLVGIPVLVTQHLGMGMEFVGISQGLMMAGGVIGGVIAGVLGSRLKITSAYLLIMMSGLVMIPIGLAFLLNVSYSLIYVIITAACALALTLITMANIQIVSLIQTETPTELIGKVMSLVVMLPFLAQALGQLIFGVVFEQLAALPYVIMFVTAGIVVMIAIYTGKSFKAYKA
ncbi:MAG: hypothetical protein FWE32_08890 [Oscillospiraceae bacterium]|nr:hypothetical protein [Oscillospiraceae bacterium]